jgi:hypothetical protein
MDARLARLSVVVAALAWSAAVHAATHRTPNFVVDAPTDEIARQVGEAAEFYRCELAKEWLGKPLPRWYRPCPIRVKVGQIGAGGATTFTFEGGEVFGWNMNVQGTLERILDSVIPHEVSHTIFACYFRRPLPRWADEGAATLVEHESERLRQTKLLNQVMQTSRRIPLRELLAINEYPQDMQQVLTLYAEGHSLADFLVQQKGDAGKAAYLAFLKDALDQNWTTAFRQHYGYENLEAAEKHWTGWVLAGSPELPKRDGTRLADNGTRPAAAPTTGEVAHSDDNWIPPHGAGSGTELARGQSPPPPAPLAKINRPLRTRPRGRTLSAPEPNVTARPDAGGPNWNTALASDGRAAAPQPEPTESARRLPVMPDRTRPADGRSVAATEGRSDPSAVLPPAGSGFPQSRVRGAQTWPEDRFDGSVSP